MFMKYAAMLMLLLALFSSCPANAGVDETQAAAQVQVKTYNWTLEAYKDGRLVASEPFTNTAISDQQAAEFVSNKLACWGQELDARGVKWDALHSQFRGKN